MHTFNTSSYEDTRSTLSRYCFKIWPQKRSHAAPYSERDVAALPRVRCTCLLLLLASVLATSPCYSPASLSASNRWNRPLLFCVCLTFNFLVSHSSLRLLPLLHYTRSSLFYNDGTTNIGKMNLDLGTRSL